MIGQQSVAVHPEQSPGTFVQAVQELSVIVGLKKDAVVVRALAEVPEAAGFEQCGLYGVGHQ